MDTMKSWADIEEGKAGRSICYATVIVAGTGMVLINVHATQSK